MMQSNNNGSRTLRYVYTADDERIAIHDGTTVKWRLRGVDNKVLREYRLQGGTWSWQKDHIYRGSSLLASDEPTIGVRHFALDHLGTPRLITSSTGATVSLHNYYPFGQEATSETQDAEVMKFTGHERDTELTNALSSIDYMHARYYSVRLGRFLSVDPKLTSGRPSIPQSWNRFLYVSGRSLGYVDLTGEDLTPVEILATGGTPAIAYIDSRLAQRFAAFNRAAASRGISFTYNTIFRTGSQQDGIRTSNTKNTKGTSPHLAGVAFDINVNTSLKGTDLKGLTALAGEHSFSPLRNQSQDPPHFQANDLITRGADGLADEAFKKQIEQNQKHYIELEALRENDPEAFDGLILRLYTDSTSSPRESE